jgi:hypothetical protein
MLENQLVSQDVTQRGDNFFLEVDLSNTTPPKAYSINLITLEDE